METYRNRIMKKYLFIALLVLCCISCSSEIEIGLIGQVEQQMERYIYNQYEDSYDYRALETKYEYTDSLCWEKDLYQIQHLFYYARNRRTVVTNSYVDPNEINSNSSILPILLLYNSSSIFEYPFVDTKNQKGLNKRLRDSYITKEEREVCDYYFYSSSVSAFREEIERLESREFSGWRIYHSCQFRTASGEIVQKQYVLYHDKDSEWSYFGNPYELSYNYPMFRDYIKNVLSINLESEEVQKIIKKYSSEDKNLLWNYSTSKLQGIYDNAISRLSIN